MFDLIPNKPIGKANFESLMPFIFYSFSARASISRTTGKIRVIPNNRADFSDQEKKEIVKKCSEYLGDKNLFSI